MNFGDYYIAIGIAFASIAFIAGCVYVGYKAAVEINYIGIDIFMDVFIGCFCLPFLAGLVWIIIIPAFIISGVVFLFVKRTQN